MKRTYLLTILLGMFFAHIGVANADVGTILRNVPDEARCCFVKGTKEVEQMKVLPVGKTTSKTFSIPLSQVGKVQSLVISGNIKKMSKDYVVRIILKDKERGEHLVLESYEEIHSGIDALDFSNYGEETFMLEKGVYADSLKICIKDAEVSLKSVAFASEMNEKLDIASNRKMQVQSVVDRINTYCKENNKLWRAKVTGVALMPYSQKKKVVGISDGASSWGIEYYGGGIFEIGSKEAEAKRKLVAKRKSATTPPINYAQIDTSGIYPDSFSWRSRHGIDWMTHHKSQHGSNFCTAFAAVGTLESIANLYYNHKVDFNLSEQYLINNVATNCSNMSISNALEGLIRYGVCDSISCPYQTDSNTTSYRYKVKIADFINTKNTFGDNENTSDMLFWQRVKKELINSGPMLSGYQMFEHSEGGGHTMVLYGYGTIHVGDTIYFQDHNAGIFQTTSYEIVGEDNDYLACNYWIFKNTYDTGGDQLPNMKIFFSPSTCIIGPYILNTPLTTTKPSTSDFTLPTIICEDNDGDGYYNWGIGPKPPYCPAGVSDLPDFDDSDSTKGGMDIYGQYTPTNPDILDTIIISNNETVNDTIHIYQHVLVGSNAEWNISAPIVFHNGAKLMVQSGGKVLCLNKITNLNLDLKSGGEFITDSNDGKIKVAKNKTFTIPIGGSLQLYQGKIE